MSAKTIVISDPGIDGAYALTLALFDPEVDVLAIAATAGNVSAEQATTNVHVLVEHLDPPRLPRIGAALQAAFEDDCTWLHGPGGLGGITFPCAPPHHPHPADKVIVDAAHQHPGEVSVVVLGPLTALARAFERDPNLPRNLKQVIVVGGSWHEPGNAGPVSEFHFACDALAARQVLRSGATMTLIPLDVTTRALFSPRELADMPGNGVVGQFLRRIVPFGVQATAQQCGIEGFYLQDVVGVSFLARPDFFKTRPMHVDVETRGELTRGMTVFDQRPEKTDANVYLVTDMDWRAVRNYVDLTFAAMA